MGYYRNRDGMEKAGGANFRCIEVMLVKKSRVQKLGGGSEVLTVDNHWDTLRYVQENMDLFMGNIVKVKRLQSEGDEHLEETARLFEGSLEPLFGLMSAISKEHVMDKLSDSLKKALLLMAMDRYNCDPDSICRALGLTRLKLEKELSRCGITHNEIEPV